jgi:electron transfer flavoprotein alpha subunit
VPVDVREMNMSTSIVIIAEHADGRIHPVTDELAAAASVLQQETAASDICIVVIGETDNDMASAIAAKTGRNVLAIHVPGRSDHCADVYIQVLTDILMERRPSYVLTAHSTQSLDVLPGLAVRLGAACITGVEGIVREDDNLCFRRAVCGGKIMADVHADNPMVLLTVLPGAFVPDPDAATPPGSVTVRTMDFTSRRRLFCGIIRKNMDASSALTEADIIVAAGRGIGEKDNLNLIYRLAALFPKSAVAGSRIVCDNGWLAYAQQVGVTGCTVSPRLYIACGISGAVQHVSGMRGSGFVVSINTDPHAAIFNVSDVCVVEDITTFIPILVENFEKQFSE